MADDHRDDHPDGRRDDRSAIVNGEHQLHGVGDVGELEPFGPAERIAVDLVRERILVLDHEMLDIDPDVEMRSRFDAPATQRPGERGQNVRCVHRGERDRHQTPIERGGGRQIERPVAEIGVRIRVEHDREVAVVDVGATIAVQAKVWSAMVVPGQPGGHSRPDEQRVAEPTLERAVTFDAFDHGGIEADPGVEAEVAAVDLAQTDRSKIGCIDAVREVVGRLDRIVRHAKGAREHVRRAAREHAERGVRAGDPGGDLVQRAVPAETDHDIDAATGGVMCETSGVSASVGLDELDLVALAEAAMHDHRVARVTDEANELTTSRIRKEPTVAMLGEDRLTTIVRRQLSDDLVARVWALVDPPVTWASL